MKLELRHLKPYLDHRLKIQNDYGVKEMTDSGLGVKGKTSISEALRIGTPILRPLSDLTKEIKIDGEKFIPIIRMYNTSRKLSQDTEIDFEWVEAWSGNLILRHKSSANYYTDFIYSEYSFYSSAVDVKNKKGWNNKIENQYFLFEMLFEYKFDVFGLIENNLAIDINTLQPTNN